MVFDHDRKFFDVTDFGVFSITLIVPILIGMYYAFISKKKPTTISEYLIGSRNMKVFPISMSLSASYIAGYALIGPIAEVYFYGFQYFLGSISQFLGFVSFAALYLPVFYNLKITSTYEYLQMRFDYKVRLLGSFLFVIKTVLNMALWLYAPILMFGQVMGLDLNVLIPIFSAICVFYTTFGGIRAVIWTDTFQMIIMLLGMIIVIVIGTYDLGEIKEIWEVNKKGSRLQNLDFNLDPRLRQSFWTIIMGYTIHCAGYISSSQYIVQRCVSLPTLSKAKIAVMINLIVGTLVLLISCYAGLMLYASFHDCDPISAKMISNPDQLLPYFIMNLKSRIPILPGTIVSVVFCSALSSISTGLNSTSGVVLIDFIRPFSKKPITDAQGSLYMKIIVVLTGVVFTGMTYTLNSANNLIQSTMALTSITVGSTFGIFTLGIFLPWANANGAFVGGIAGGIMVAWISIGAQISKRLPYPKLPLSIENCGNSTFGFINKTLETSPNFDQHEPFSIYAISFNYYAMIGTFTTIIVGMIISYFTGFKKVESMDGALFSPVIQKFLRKNPTGSENIKMMTK